MSWDHRPCNVVSNEFHFLFLCPGRFAAETINLVALAPILVPFLFALIQSSSNDAECLPSALLFMFGSKALLSLQWLWTALPLCLHCSNNQVSHCELGQQGIQINQFKGKYCNISVVIFCKKTSVGPICLFIKSVLMFRVCKPFPHHNIWSNFKSGGNILLWFGLQKHSYTNVVNN